MKSKMNKGLIALTILFTPLLFAFSDPNGGDHFEIYLNSQLLHKQFNYGDKKVHTISLNGAKADDVVKVYYSHCGKLGVDRKVIIQDENNNDLKKWSYDNGDEKSKYLTFKVKDIVDLRKSGTNLKLRYASKELPEGHVLAVIKTSISLAKK